MKACLLREFLCFIMFWSRLIALFCMSTCIRQVQCVPVKNHDNEVFGDVFAKAIDYAKKNQETLEEIINSHDAFTEGDILMNSNRNALDAIWPAVNGIVSVAFKIHPDLDKMTDTILKAMEMVSENTCVSFHNRSTEPDYVHFQPHKGCASYVGYQGGEQMLYVGPLCNIGNVAHEILHALGFHHEHTRLDRDNHVKILVDNIQTGREANFDMKNGKTYDIPYDTSSIMHYGGHYFSKNGLPTITALMYSGEMGQRTYLTPKDLRRIRTLYQCDKTLPEDDEKFLNFFDRLKEFYLHVPGISANLNTNN